MRFTHIALQNFMSFGEPAQLMDLSDRGLLAVFGNNLDSQGSDSNGAGKSTVMEAIVWALYGSVMREDYKGDAVINIKAGRNCVVELGIEDGQTRYVIRRARKVASKRSNDLTLLVNDSDASAGTMADTQSMIQTIIGMDMNTFTQSVMLRHGSRSFSRMTDKEQKEVLEDILQVDAMTKARDLVKSRIIDRQQRYASLNAKIGTLLAARDELQIRSNKLVTQRDQHAQLMAQKRKDLTHRKIEWEAQIESIYQNTGLDKLMAVQEDLTSQMTELESVRTDINTQLTLCTRTYATKRADIARKEGELNAMVSQAGVELRKLNDLAGRPCPHCGQDMSPDKAEAAMRDLSVRSGELTVELQKWDTTSKKLSAKELKDIKKIEAMDAKVATSWSNIQNQMRLSTEQVQKRRSALQSICQLEQSSWAVQQQIDGLDDDSNPYGSLVEDAEEETRVLATRVRSMEYKAKSLDIELCHLKWWSHGFGNQGLKSYIFDNVVPFLTQRAQKYADILSGGDLRIQFATQTQLKSGEWRDHFQVKVTNQQGADVYTGNSDGEKRRIDIAVGWALGDLAASRAKKSIRFKGLDEPFENLDETGDDAVIKLLHSVLSEYETIVCVTHSTHLRDQFPHDVIVTKENGVSTIQ